VIAGWRCAKATIGDNDKTSRECDRPGLFCNRPIQEVRQNAPRHREDTSGAADIDRLHTLINDNSDGDVRVASEPRSGFQHGLTPFIFQRDERC
jgi:hypothetical protein